MWRETLESKALREPSISKILASFLYRALAKAILDFCPPESYVPISPSLVRSPFDNYLKSSVNAQALTTLSYHLGSNWAPNKILERTVPLIINGFYSAYDMCYLELTLTTPLTKQSSWRIVRNSDVFPLPTFPIIATFSFLWNEKDTSLMTVSIRGWESCPSFSISSPVSLSSCIFHWEYTVSSSIDAFEEMSPVSVYTYSICY